MVSETETPKKFNTLPGRLCCKKISPGPFRATKLWNQIVQLFQEDIPTGKHWRNFKCYKNCFVASDAVDVLYNLLENNRNIASELSRQKIIKLLQKFLKDHVIEDIYGKWGSDDFEDNKCLYRIGKRLDESPSSPHVKPSISKTVRLRDNKIPKTDNPSTTSKRMKFGHVLHKSTCFNADTSATVVSSPLSKTAFLPLCKSNVFLKEEILIADEEENEVWRNVVISNIKKVLNLQTLDNIVNPQDIKGDWIKHNVTNVGTSGVVRPLSGRDLPGWVTRAMCTLANWPQEEIEACYDGFEKDVFKVIAGYYHGEEASYATEKPSNPCCAEKPIDNNSDNGTTDVSCPLSKDPLLTFALYELFTNIVCTFDNQSMEPAMKALRLSLLLLPPLNRRKLHLLLKFMVKISNNPFLASLHSSISTRHLVLYTFSSHVLSYFEDIPLNDLLAQGLVTYLMDNHEEVMKVPAIISEEVEKELRKLRESKRCLNGGEAVCTLNPSNYLSDTPLKQKAVLTRSKSADAAKHFLTNSKSKSKSTESILSSNEVKSKRRWTKLSNKEEYYSSEKQKLRGSKTYNLKRKSTIKIDLKPALSCPDISRDEDDLQKSEETHSSRHSLLDFFKRLRKHR